MLDMSEITTPEPWPPALGDTRATLYCSSPLLRKIKVIRNFLIATGRDVAIDKVKLAILQSAGGVDMEDLMELVGKVLIKGTPVVVADVAEGIGAVAATG